MERKRKKETSPSPSPKIKQEKEEKVENVPPPPLLAEEMHEQDRVDRVIFDTMPPGYRFVPTGEELINYLKKKIFNLPLPHNRIRDDNVYKCDPEQLTSMYKLHRGKEWYFFTSRTKKYPNGQRPDRAAGNGFWKATGADFPINDKQGVKIGTKKTLVYYIGKAKEKNQTKTDWIMHEYRVEDDNANNVDPVAKKDTNELDRWVLCKIYYKSFKEGDVIDNRQDDNNMMIVPTNSEQLPNQNPNRTGSENANNIQVQSSITNQGWNGANSYNTSTFLMQNPNISQGIEGGCFHNMASLLMRNVQVSNPHLGFDNANNIPVQNGQAQSQSWDGANFYNTRPFLMQNVHVQNPNITQGLDGGRFRNLASLPMLIDVQEPNPNITQGLDSGRFYNMASGPMRNVHVPNPSITQGLESGCSYNNMESGPYGGVFDNTVNLHMQNGVEDNLNNVVGFPLSGFDQRQNMYATNEPYFQSWEKAHVYNQQGLNSDPFQTVEAQNQYQMSQARDYQDLGILDNEVTNLIDYTPSDHNLSQEDMHCVEPTVFPDFEAAVDHKDEEPLDCKGGQLRGPDQALSPTNKKG